VGEWRYTFTLRPLYTREGASSTHWIGGGVGPTAGLEAVLKRKESLPLPGIESGFHEIHTLIRNS
jgi:hypothetical protein